LRTALLEVENYRQKEVVWVAVIPMCRGSEWWSYLHFGCHRFKNSLL